MFFITWTITITDNSFLFPADWKGHYKGPALCLGIYIAGFS